MKICLVALTEMSIVIGEMTFGFIKKRGNFQTSSDYCTIRFFSLSDSVSEFPSTSFNLLSIFSCLFFHFLFLLFLLSFFSFFLSFVDLFHFSIHFCLPLLFLHSSFLALFFLPSFLPFYNTFFPSLPSCVLLFIFPLSFLLLSFVSFFPCVRPFPHILYYLSQFLSFNSAIQYSVIIGSVSQSFKRFFVILLFMHYSVSLSVNRSASQPVSQSASQSVNKSASQSVSQPASPFFRLFFFPPLFTYRSFFPPFLPSFLPFSHSILTRNPWCPQQLTCVWVRMDSCNHFQCPQGGDPRHGKPRKKSCGSLELQ